MAEYRSGYYAGRRLDAPKIKLTQNEIDYVNNVPKEEAVRMLGEVGFAAGMLNEFGVTEAEVKLIRVAEQSYVTSAEGKVPISIVASGYIDGLNYQAAKELVERANENYGITEGAA